MSERLLTVEQILTILAESPLRIAALTTGLSPVQLRTFPGEGEWSVNDVLAHLRSCADVWGGAIMLILTQDNPTIKGVNPRTWIKQTDYPQQEFLPSFKAFTEQRKALIDRLVAITPEDWSLKAIVTGAGRPFKKTVQDYAHILASHERTHVRQMERAANVLRG